MIEPVSETNPAMDESKKNSEARAQALLAEIPAALSKADDEIERKLHRENSSSKSKLRKIYALLNEFSSIATAYSACKKGCSACCKMNVSITELEALAISGFTGRTPSRVSAPISHELSKYSGVACPFLVDGICSIYPVRPFACRAHFQYDLTSYWCQPERANNVPLTLLRLEGAHSAYNALALKSTPPGFADIRDFFPPEKATLTEN